MAAFKISLKAHLFKIYRLTAAILMFCMFVSQHWLAVWLHLVRISNDNVMYQ